ncbi:MAG: hypothetical protein MUC78_03310 [Bacteroidales bacterium]|jgi:hypothetical protein|nr:hypothetical protein [Bacteroidales bacterium]
MKHSIHICNYIIAFLALIALCNSSVTHAHSAIPDSINKSFRLFEDDTILEITLQFDLSTYLRAKPKEEYLKGKITFHPALADSITRDIRIRTRGEFRNNWCFYAPIELNLKNANFGYSDLDSISKIKMVPQCTSTSESAKYVLIEYLIYKMYSVMTDTSFRVRLLTVNYIDSENKKKPFTQYGFLIEPLKMLAERTNSVEVTSRGITQKNIYPEIMDRVAIFNYMVGNYDWAVPNRHNIKVLKPLTFDNLNLAVAVPYDFDWTGLVNAGYAIPDDKITGTTTVRERIFLGVCRSREEYQKDLVLFHEKKDEFYNVITQFLYLNENQKRDMINYLEEFYDLCTGKQRILEVFTNSCKNF